MKPLNHPYFVKFIVYFNQNQDFFECHEVLEDYWNEVPNRTKDHPLTAYILLATGLYHWRRENHVGAARTLRKAAKKIREMPVKHPLFTKGIDFSTLNRDVQNTLSLVEEKKLFKPFPIGITSDELALIVKTTEQRMNLLPLNSEMLIHKHKLRDRTNILQKKKKELSRKSKE